MNTYTRKFLAACVAAFAILGVARADRIELANGSVIVGKIVSAEAGKFKVETDFAGTVEVAQDKIKSFSTDAPVNVGLKSGSAVLGRVEPSTSGLAVVATDGTTTTTTEGVTAVWAPGADSPQVRLLKEEAEKLKRKWAFEAALGLSGRTGVAERFSSALAFKATLESSQDKLVFSAAAEQASDEGVETANRQYGGVDYSSFFGEKNKNVWYARTSLEHDEFKALDLRSTTAAGIGRKFIKEEKQDLEGRIGVSYLYESYTNGTTFDSPGLDLALIHSITWGQNKLSSSIGYTPAFEDFGNYRVHVESAYETPLTASLWKLKLGVTADYTSMPQPGIDKFDLLYFTSLILNWK